MQYASKVRYLLAPSAGAILLAPAPPCTKRTWLNAPEAPMLYAVEPMSPARSSQDRDCSSIIFRGKSGSPGSNMHIAQAKIWSFLVSVVLCAFVIISKGRALVPLLGPVLELLGRIVRRS